MKEHLREIFHPSVFNFLRSLYRIALNAYRQINPYVNTSSFFNNYTQADRRKSILPARVNYLKATPLCQIMKRQGSDKGLYQAPGHHNYTFFYDAAFQKFKNKPLRLFEMGIGTTNTGITHNMGVDGKPGASLKGWKEYFPMGSIYSADIDREILFEEEGIKTFYVDQLDSILIKNMWTDNEVLKEQFDIIIDDGLHTVEANQCFFENSIHKLQPGGLYIIEDVGEIFLGYWKKLIKNEYEKSYPFLKFLIMNLPNDFNKGENALIVIEKFVE